ncbi:MAG: methionyl-tRNA formyltransferase [Thermomicrobiales bacterium]
MSDGNTPRTEPWRVVILTDFGGQVVNLGVRLFTGMGHQVVGVVTGPGPKKRRTDDYLDVVRAVPPGIDVIVTTHMSRLAALLAPLRPDLIFSAGFKWRVPTDVLQLPRLGVINLHFGLLPERRGANPVGWAFREDDREQGATIHRMNEGFDTGPILAQARVPVGDDDAMEDLFPRIVAAIPPAMGRALARVAQGDPGDPQDESRAFYADLFTDDWREIDWSQPARTVHNQVRSWFGVRGTARGAFALLDGERVLITRTRLVPNPDVSLAPGATLRRDDNTLLVGCGDGPLAILTSEPVGAAESPAAPAQ